MSEIAICNNYWLHLHHGACFGSHSWVVQYRSFRKRHAFPVLYSERRNLKDCCGLPSNRTTVRWLPFKSSPVTLVLLSFGHATGFCESILNEKFPDLQNSSGVPAVDGGSCGIGATQISPETSCATRTVDMNSRTATIALFMASNLARTWSVCQMNAVKQRLHSLRIWLIGVNK